MASENSIDARLFINCLSAVEGKNMIMSSSDQVEPKEICHRSYQMLYELCEP